MISQKLLKPLNVILHLANILIILVFTDIFIFKLGSFSENFSASLKYFPIGYAAFCLSNLYITPNFFFKKKYANHILLSFGLVIVTASLSILVFKKFDSYHQTELSLLAICLTTFFLHTLYVFKGFVVAIIIMFCKQSILKTNLNKQKNKDELKYLMHQMESHFLFNTINNLYAMALQNAANMPEMLLQLTNVLRHLVYNNPTEKTILINELEAVKSYIAVLQLGYTKKLPILITEDKELDTALLPNGTLLTLIEGAIKHMCFKQNEQAYINIDVKEINKNLSITVQNSICPKNQTHDYGGIGLSNLINRLQIIYPEKNILLTSIENNTFTAEIKIPIEYEDLRSS